MDIGKRIRILRMERQLTQISLAKKAGISNTYISDIEKGRTSPSLSTLNKLSKALDVDIKTFF